MYKVSIAELKAFKENLIESNRLLRLTLEAFDNELIRATIESNEKQIKIITEKFHIDETNN